MSAAGASFETAGVEGAEEAGTRNKEAPRTHTSMNGRMSPLAGHTLMPPVIPPFLVIIKEAMPSEER
jgi:hypothetical protein